MHGGGFDRGGRLRDGLAKALGLPAISRTDLTQRLEVEVSPTLVVLGGAASLGLAARRLDAVERVHVVIEPAGAVR